MKHESMQKQKKKPAHIEENIQITCVNWFRLQYPELIIFAVPNGGSRNLYEAKNLKDAGVLAGVADLIIVGNNGKIMFVEMKAGKNKQTDSQIGFQQSVEKLGHKYIICRSLVQFIKEVNLWV